MRLLMALGALALLTACDDAGSEAEAATEPTPPAVRLTVAQPRAALQGRTFVGRVEPLRTVELSFELSGQLIALNAQAGETLPKGAVVAELDPAGFELALRRAEARRDLAQREFDRASDLTARGAAPQAREDETVAELRLAEVEYDAARRDLALTTMTAPFDMLVTRRLIDAFSYVTPQNPILRVQDVSELRVAISVPEDLIRFAREPGAFEAQARLSALGGEVFPLTLREIVTEADDVAQTYRVSFALQAPPDAGVLPGMTATVGVAPLMQGAAALPVIPLSALDGDGPDGPRVWVYDPEDGAVRPRPVRVELPQGDLITVTEGLAVGETVVSAGLRRLADGRRVRPMADDLARAPGRQAGQDR
ncbi:MAG: efflux RND transporter periplasmic adaptor subunit [Rubrimonas sp.]